MHDLPAISSEMAPPFFRHPCHWPWAEVSKCAPKKFRTTDLGAWKEGNTLAGSNKSWESNEIKRNQTDQTSEDVLGAFNLVSQILIDQNHQMKVWDLLEASWSRTWDLWRFWRFWRKPLALRVFQAVPCEFPDEMMLSPKRPGLGWRQRALSRTEPHGTDDRVMWYNELQPDHAIPIISIQFSSVDIIHEVLYLTASTNKIQIPETYHYWLSAPLSRQDRDIIDIQLVRASQSCFESFESEKLDRKHQKLDLENLENLGDLKDLEAKAWFILAKNLV